MRRAKREPCGAVTVAALVGAGLGGPARAVECPVPHPTSSPTAIGDTERDIRDNSNLLLQQGPSVIPEMVARLKEQHPNAGNAEITNYLVTLYCPILNRNAALSEAERRALLMVFSSHVMEELANRAGSLQIEAIPLSAS